jgi:hypothetical protein
VVRTAIRAAAVTALAAAAVTASAATAPAASAQPTTLVVSVSSATDSTTPKSVTVECPATHPFLTGPGGSTSGAYYNVALTAVVPTAISATASAAELSPTTSGWSVTVYAVCSASTKTTRYETAVPDSLITPKVAVAECPDDTELYGTGFALTGTAASGLPTDVVPARDVSRVTVTAEDNGGVAGVWGLVAYAMCGPAVRSQVVVAADDAQLAPPPVAGPCPDGTVLTGVGGELFDGGGAWLTGLVPSNAGTASSTEGVWYATSATLTAYAICVPL